MKATLILENGITFVGESIGSTDERICELVFNTAMVGYQEMLTDPSYAGQGIVMSYPLIGNYGVNSEDNVSGQTWAEALVVRCLSPRGSNFRNEGDLGSYLKEHNITGIQGIDTRALTKILRNQGTMNAMISCAEHFDITEVRKRLMAHRKVNAISRVTTSETVVVPAEGALRSIAVLDVGEKQTITQALVERGCTVTRLNAYTSADDILAGGYDGLVISNGPGDPADNGAIIAEIKKLAESGLPIFGIGLGHQLLALAAGAETESLLYGHRGSNIPVRDFALGRVLITAQNHGYTVKGDSVNADIAEISHVNVNDGSCEGIVYKNNPIFSVQFDPQTRETTYLYDKFVTMVDNAKKEGAKHA